MFLLIPGGVCQVRRRTKFTFHNVSINSLVDLAVKHDYENLHSTMFLLIHLSQILLNTSIPIYIPQCFY